MDVNERWLPVVGYEGLYDVSDYGNVRRAGSTGELVSQNVDADGYMAVCLKRDSSWRVKKAHRVVLEAFAGPCPYKMECCHGNGVRFDNRLSNLRWDTRSANAIDRRKHPSSLSGENHHKAKLTYECVERIRDLLTCDVSLADIGRKFYVPYQTISKIKRFRKWGEMSW